MSQLSSAVCSQRQGRLSSSKAFSGVSEEVSHKAKHGEDEVVKEKV
jgi:hypothetical protein